MPEKLQKLLKSKTVGFFGGLALLFNQITGPGVPFTATNFQSPGWVTTVASYFIFCFVSGFSILFLIESIHAIPGNSQFQGNVEYSTLINFYFGSTAHIIGQLFLYGALQSNAIQSLVLTAQAIDNILLDTAGNTCGLTGTLEWICVSQRSDSLPSPFDETFMLFTFGLVATLIIATPLGFLDIENNMTVNAVAFVFSLLIGAQWICSSFNFDISRIPAFAAFDENYGQVMGTVMLNLACCAVIPSWINIKSKDVKAQSLIWLSLFISSLYYLMLGFFLALGYTINESGNILADIYQEGKPSGLSKFTVGMFSFVMLLPGVPISFIVSKNNLTQNKVCSSSFATFLSFVLPCLLCIPLQTGEVLIKFQTWSSLVFVSGCNFVLPFLLYFKCIRFRRDFNKRRVLTKHQIDLLYEIHSNAEDIRQYLDAKKDMADHHDEYQLTIQKNHKPIERNESAMTNLLIFDERSEQDSFSAPADVLYRNRGPSHQSFIEFFEQQTRFDSLPDDMILAVRQGYSGEPRAEQGERSAEFVNPEIMGLAGILSDDVPDVPDSSVSDNLPSPRSGHSFDSNLSRNSLPRHPDFITPAFRSVPKWLRVQRRVLAIIVMSIALFFSIGNIGLNLWFIFSE